jgi:hypothetical protein|tara:strand:- start:229 stop:555 length:327 start_codon:yes stop_codon:yes gene_type:complete
MAYIQGNNPISRKTSPVLQNFAADGGIPVEKETKKHSLETAEDAPVYKGLVAVKGQRPLQGPSASPDKETTFLPPVNNPPAAGAATFKSGAAKQGPNGQYSIQSTTTY